MKLGSPVNRASRARKVLAGALALSAAVMAAPAAQAVDWQSANVQLLYGTTYANDFGIDDNRKAIITIEYANGWSYGDTFLFVDISNPTADGTSLYGEFSPRFSFDKITGTSLAFGPAKEVLLATTLELGEDVNALLIGPGVALDLPGFAFADINFYYRKSHRAFAPLQTNSGYQVTVDWSYPFKIGGVGFSFEGFFDYAFAEKGGSAPKANNIIAAPRLLVNVSELLGIKTALQAGIEYQVWHNKYGIDGVHENVAQAMIKWAF